MQIDLESYAKWSKASHEFDEKMQMKLKGQSVDGDVWNKEIVRLKELLENFMSPSENNSESF